MSDPQPVTIDFESFAIEDRPAYPPLPVGVSIKWWKEPSRYYAWGHPTGNNSDWGNAKRALAKAWKCPDGVLGHHLKFDLDVVETHFGLPRLPWQRLHDTLFLLFLDDPHQRHLGLKPSAERLLGLKPEEQDAVGDWLVTHQPVPGVKISKSLDSDHYFGKYIAYAPGGLVGTYAKGDVIRTEMLFKKLYRSIQSRGMGDAYDRERRLLPILLDNERQGVKVDQTRLTQDVGVYDLAQAKLDQWLLRKLKAPEGFNLNSGQQLAKQLIKVGLVDESLMGVTPSGKTKTDKEALELGVKDPQLYGVLKYRTQLNTCLRTFMKPWLSTALRSHGLIYTTWNQTKATDGSGQVGTRTGRLSSTPNFQNIPNSFKPAFKHQDPKQPLPRAPFELPALPQVRSYLVPWRPGDVLLKRDYSQQELRILGHFEDGVLAQAYQADPWLDVHDHARTLINKMTGKNFDRKPIKNTGFGLIYGMGIGKLAIQSDVDIDTAKEVKDAYLAIFPGLKAMYRDMKARAQAKQPIRTWGGREYYCEEPKIVKGRLMTFDYKLLNVLIQGSAADCTKEAAIRYHEVKPKDHVMYLTVHDEFLNSVPGAQLAKGMACLREAMESVKFDVPMLSEGAISFTNWAQLDTYDKKGEITWHTKKS